MDKCLRIALCFSFLLFSEIHAAPLCRSLGLNNLKEVTCGSNFTIASPILQTCSLAAAMLTFERGLRSAMTMGCTDDNEQLDSTLEALERCKIQTQADSTECKLEQKTFPEFVEALGTFREYNNTNNNQD